MRIEHLAGARFRNLARFALDFPARTVVLRGANGQGKTNLLEAIYLCATGRSFRQAPSAELIAWDHPQAELQALFSRQGVRHHVEVTLTPHRRVVRLDGRHLAQTSALLRWVNVVAFFPDDLRLAKGGPEERRRFLDRAVANLEPSFVDAALAYQRVLRSRNALLRREGRFDQALLTTYDEQLITHGATMHQARSRALAAFAPLACACFAEVIPEVGPLTVELTTGLGELDDVDYSHAFAEALHRAAPRDRRQGNTGVGPHRADLVLGFGGHPARQFASQGQQRAMVLALKLAEVRILRQQLGLAPILLLDDVSSELDDERIRRLFVTLSALGSQVWLTTTGTAPLPIADDALILSLKTGQVA